MAFVGFELRTVAIGAGDIRLRVGGKGPPVLLLHGHPRTHMTWGKVADLLAPAFTVVCPDLPGFGQSYVPLDSPDSYHSSKKAKAAALVELMSGLGYDEFFLVGHDRGSLTAFRMAMDYPEAVKRLVLVDCLPVLEHLERADWKFARDWHHWFFFAQPEKPERVISADPEGWYDKLSPDVMGDEAYADILAAIYRPETVHGMIEDYRAGIRIDHLHDKADRDAGRKIHWRCSACGRSVTISNKFMVTPLRSGGAGRPMSAGSGSIAGIMWPRRIPAPLPRRFPASHAIEECYGKGISLISRSAGV